MTNKKFFVGMLVMVIGNVNTRGGGVHISASSNFIKSGNSIITGWNSDAANGNVVRNASGTVVNNAGHAVFAAGSGSSLRRQETTAGAGHNLLFDNTTSPPTITGNWDFP